MDATEAHLYYYDSDDEEVRQMSDDSDNWIYESDDDNEDVGQQFADAEESDKQSEQSSEENYEVIRNGKYLMFRPKHPNDVRREEVSNCTARPLDDQTRVDERVNRCCVSTHSSQSTTAINELLRVFNESLECLPSDGRYSLEDWISKQKSIFRDILINSLSPEVLDRQMRALSSIAVHCDPNSKP